MRIVVSLPQVSDDVAACVRAAREAEDAGAWGVSVFDHLAPPMRPDRPALDGWTLLGLVARATSSVRLVMLVGRTGVRPPALVARTASLVQGGSGGRLVLGLGVGDATGRAEEARFGIAGPSRAERLAEAEAIRRALHSDPTIRPRTDPPPVWLGGNGPDVVQAASRADGWHGWGLTTSDFTERADQLPEGVQRWWGGVYDPASAAETVRGLEDAGADGLTWTIYSGGEPDHRRELLRSLA